MIALPVSLLSGFMLPLVLAPLWLQTLAGVNPFSYAVNASRAPFAGDFANADIWIGFLVMAVLSVLLFWWSVKSLRKMAA